MVPPCGGDAVDDGFERVGIVGDKGDGEIQPHKADDQRQHRQGREHAGRDGKTACGLTARGQSEYALARGCGESEESEEVPKLGDQPAAPGAGVAASVWHFIMPPSPAAAFIFSYISGGM